MTRVIGWDVGGANTKAAWADGAALRAVTRPFALWREPGSLPRVLREVGAALGPADAMAVTMTAELADCFATREKGVRAVLAAVASAFPGVPLHVFTVGGTFVSPAEARRRPIRAASANWLATARWLAGESGDSSFLIDAGSTTTDLVPIVGGEVVAEGRADLERLAAGELVYTGAVRTPCCALARSVRVRGRRHPLAAELFAQSGDVYLWRGELSEHDYLGDTPDGRGKTRQEAGARLARMLGADAHTLGEDGITELADQLADRQVRQIAAAIRAVRARLGRRAPTCAVVVGLGAFLGEAAARRAGLGPRDGGRELGVEASRAAPAVAVARLLQRALG